MSGDFQEAETAAENRTFCSGYFLFFCAPLKSVQGFGVHKYFLESFQNMGYYSFSKTAEMCYYTWNRASINFLRGGFRSIILRQECLHVI